MKGASSSRSSASESRAPTAKARERDQRSRRHELASRRARLCVRVSHCAPDKLGHHHQRQRQHHGNVSCASFKVLAKAGENLATKLETSPHTCTCSCTRTRGGSRALSISRGQFILFYFFFPLFILTLPFSTPIYFILVCLPPPFANSACSASIRTQW